ncbi:NAD-binding protein [Rhodococcus sp. A14]|nr:NAD-binding protein [Rhodococcus sp. A14]
MIVVFGLGPIGSGAAIALSRRFPVLGIDRDTERAATFTAATGLPAQVTAGDIDWHAVTAVIVAVRLAEHLPSVFSEIPDSHLPVFVLTTLSVTDARKLPTLGDRVIEAPVSGGAAAATTGELAVFIHAPDTLTGPERALIDGMTKYAISFSRYGQPAAAKLTNNTLAAYNALAFTAMMDVADRYGIAADQFADVVNSSSGSSWMSTHFHNFPQDLLFKDVSLLQSDGDDLPAVSVTHPADPTHQILSARARLVSNPPSSPVPASDEHSTHPPDDSPTTLFAVEYEYSPDTSARDKLRPHHRRFLRQLHQEGTLVFSGPYTHTPRALLMLRTDTAEQAGRDLDNDPFMVHGLITNRNISPFRLGIGDL